jgi:hypothetical protein
MSMPRGKTLLFFCLGFGVTVACASGGDEDLAGTGNDNPSPMVLGDAGDAAARADSPSLTSDGPHGGADAPGADAAKPGTDGEAKDGPADAAVDAPHDAGKDAAKDAAAPPETGSDASVPTTCAEADETVGCCAGDVLYYCKTTTLTSKTCSGTDVCGWSTTYSDYGCVAPPGGADPSGTYPLACE